MEMLRTNTNRIRVMTFDTDCPYNGTTICMASLSSMVIDGNTKTSCCSTENYDDCPIFLSRVLRSGKLAERNR